MITLSWFHHVALLVTALGVEFGTSNAAGGLVPYSKAIGSSGNKLRGLKSLTSFTKVYDVCVAGRDSWHFIYTFDDGCVLQGYTSTSDLTLQWCQGPSYKQYPPIKLDISCTSQYSTDGYSTEAGYGPNKNEHPAISKYTIKTLQATDCECAQYCSYGSPEDQSTTTTSQQIVPQQPVPLPSCSTIKCKEGYQCKEGVGCVQNPITSSQVQVSQPTTTCKAGTDKYHYTYLFEGGCTLEGYSTTSSVLVNWCNKAYPAIKLDLSCTYNYTAGMSGYSNVAGFGPTKGTHPAIIDYSIKMLEDNSCDCMNWCN